MKPLVLALVGPTASGKSDWALKFAQKIPSSVIAADSRTVYRGLNIGTAKITQDHQSSQTNSPHGPVYNIQNVPHYGLDLADPNEMYAVGKFQTFVNNLLPTLWRAGRLPILVGGTGLYVEAVLAGYHLPAQAELPVEFKHSTTVELIKKLSQIDPETASHIDPRNRVRIERALAYTLVQKKSFLKNQKKQRPIFQSRLYVIDRPRAELYRRNDARVEAWTRGQLFSEVRKFLDQGVPRVRIQEFGLIYKLALEHVEGVIALEEFRTQLQGRLHAYVRRQLTWWRRNPAVHWVRNYATFEADAYDWLAKEGECLQLLHP
ncbi:tRNA (adenosine(37)-N6)-dimethylallyltransferase MiaA [Candidatus Berkelbacteria bacterium]|nr:tRNA (adenosine(37)-N6)-dimethylallyltransferase MiaA [Candidatus Berkelbacteria bacterium]